VIEIDSNGIRYDWFGGDKFNPKAGLDLKARLRIFWRFRGLRRLINPVPTTSLLFYRLDQVGFLCLLQHDAKGTDQ
jgi:hypothetical protein